MSNFELSLCIGRTFAFESSEGLAPCFIESFAVFGLLR